MSPDTALAPDSLREPGAAAMAQCLAVQERTRPRSAWARLVGRSPVCEDALPWYVGAVAEREVAARLRRLGPDWVSAAGVRLDTHAPPVELVLVGPGGVYTVTTKFLQDARVRVGSLRLLVDGTRMPYVRAAREEAARIRSVLSAPPPLPRSGHPAPPAPAVAVTPLIVVVGARRVELVDPPRDVVVLRDRALTRWLRRRPRILEGVARAIVVDRLAAAASAPLVLSGRGAAKTETDLTRPPDVVAFAALRRQVRNAAAVRGLWLALFILVAAAVLGLGALHIEGLLGFTG
ncbi:nuclease-related domain-containing protein [Microbacterium aurantiacum]|uniref:nuclease-related domain-containing protein n=2 Tax=Microbacterium aurantiacum TaxID=162393 RepID=UPI00343F4A3E